MLKMTTYVSLKFNSARLFRAFRNEFKVRDSYKAPITRLQMANVLYALTNQKLVNSRRYSYFEHQESFLNWADECLIQYKEQPVLSYKENERVHMHMCYLAKDKTNSTAKSPVQWRQIRYELMIRHGLREKGYAKFLDFMEKTYGVNENMEVDEFFGEVYSSEKWIKIFNFLDEHLNPKNKTRMLSVVGSFVRKDSEVKFTSKIGLSGYGHTYELKNLSRFDLNILKASTNLLTTNINHNGVGGYERYDGEILIPIRTYDDYESPIESFEDYQLLQNGPGVATILDGGSLTIDSIKTSREIVRKNTYTTIKDISLEEVKYFDTTK